MPPEPAGSADPAEPDSPSVPARAAGLPARVGDPLLPGGLPQKPLPESAPPEEAAVAAEPPPVRISVTAPSDTAELPAVSRPRPASRTGRAVARWRGAPRWARALVLTGSATLVLTGSLATWQVFGPHAEAAGEAEPGTAPGSVAGATQPPPGDDLPDSPIDPPLVAGTAPAAAPSPSPSATPRPTPTPDQTPGEGVDDDGDRGGDATAPSAPPAAPTLTADLETSGGLFGRSVRVTVSNPGPGDASGWEVVVTVPANQEVSDVSGATHHREGDQVIFTPPPGAESLPAGEAVSFSFRLPGAFPPQPSGCTIDGRPCD